MQESNDVIIAGGGPVGLFLACELAMAGVAVLVLEREHAVESSWKNGILGRRGVFIPAIEAFYRRGLLDKVVGDGQRPTHFEKTSKFQFGGHFAGMMLNANQIDFSRWKYRLTGPSFMPGATTLRKLEVVLSERAESLGVQILRGIGVSDVVNEGQMVKVWAGDRIFTAQWLVGCDGGRSTIRKAAGFEFVGTEAEFTGYATMCDLDKAEQLQPGFTRTEMGMYIVMGSGNLHVMEFRTDFDRTRPITREHIQDVIQRVSGTEVKVKELHFASSYTDRSKQATEYRRGRVLLAGDSAHIHSPLGAQGLNTGIGDAINLGWKLAAVIQGRAPTGLLDTYQSERHPEAAKVLEWTRAQVATLRPERSGRALASIVNDLIQTDEGATYFADRIWGVSQRYDLGNAHPLVGRSAPDFEFEDGERLGSRMEEACFVVMDFEHDASVARCVKSLGPMVKYCDGHADETFGLKTLLLRPDGVVAWASEDKFDAELMRVSVTLAQTPCIYGQDSRRLKRDIWLTEGKYVFQSSSFRFSPPYPTHGYRRINFNQYSQST